MVKTQLEIGCPHQYCSLKGFLPGVLFLTPRIPLFRLPNSTVIIIIIFFSSFGISFQLREVSFCLIRYLHVIKSRGEAD